MSEEIRVETSVVNWEHADELAEAAIAFLKDNPLLQGIRIVEGKVGYHFEPIGRTSLRPPFANDAKLASLADAMEKDKNES